MGYTLKIGEIFVRKELMDEDDQKTAYFHTGVISEEHKNAPAFGEPTDRQNSRWPSYTAWSNFCDFVGLEDLFYNKEYGILREHPGCVPLTQSHKEEIDKALENFKKKYPKAIPSYSTNVKNIMLEEDPTWPEENNFMVRLVWLKYWVDWALENCENPAFYNS